METEKVRWIVGTQLAVLPALCVCRLPDSRACLAAAPAAAIGRRRRCRCGTQKKVLLAWTFSPGVKAFCSTKLFSSETFFERMQYLDSTMPGACATQNEGVLRCSVSLVSIGSYLWYQKHHGGWEGEVARWRWSQLGSISFFLPFFFVFLLCFLYFIFYKC